MAALALVACTQDGGSGTRAPTSLTYSEATPSYELCGAISENLPSVGGGAATTFAVTPALPAGLEIDSATGVIHGTPTAVSPATVYTITAANARGEVSAPVTIEVTHVPPSGLSYPDLGDELGRGIYVEVKPALAFGYGSNWSISSGALPNGLALDPLDGRIHGVPTQFGAAAFDITVADCAAATTFTAFATVVVVPYGRGVCATDDVQGSVASFRRANSSGALAHNGGLWNEAGTGQLAMHPWGRLAFAAAASSIDAYAIDSRSLELRATGFGAAAGNGAITDLAISPDGLRLFASTQQDRIYSYQLDPLTGELTPTTPAFAVTGSAPNQLAVTHDGAHLFVACSGSDAIQRFSIDALDGHLTALDAVASGLGVRALALSADGARLYAGSLSDTRLFGYEVAALSSALTPSSWSPVDIAAAGHVSLAITPDDDHLYIAFESTDLLRGFDLDPVTGEPFDLPSGPVQALGNGRQLAVEPRGAHLYSVHQGGWIQCWAIAVDGELSSAPIGACMAGASPRELGIVLGHARFRMSTQNVYATSLGADGVYEYALDATSGTLTAAPATPLATGQDPQTIALHPFSEQALVAHASPLGAGALTVHALDDSGLLGAGTGFGSSTSNVGAAFDGSGRFAYLVRSQGGTAQLLAYGFDARTGALDALGTTAFAATAWPPAVHPSGRLVVVPDSLADSLRVFTLDPQSGTVTSTSSVSTGGVDPFRVVFDPSGRFAFSAHLGNDRVSVHAIDLPTGTLAPIAGSPFVTGIRPLVMANSPDGTTLMIADTLLGQWEAYGVDLDPSSPAVDGALTLAGSGAQPGIAILRFDASGTRLIWVDSLAGEVLCSPFTAPGTLGAPLSWASIGTQVTSMVMRNR